MFLFGLRQRQIHVFCTLALALSLTLPHSHLNTHIIPASAHARPCFTLDSLCLPAGPAFCTPFSVVHSLGLAQQGQGATSLFRSPQALQAANRSLFNTTVRLLPHLR